MIPWAKPLHLKCHLEHRFCNPFLDHGKVPKIHISNYVYRIYGGLFGYHNNSPGPGIGCHILMAKFTKNITILLSVQLDRPLHSGSELRSDKTGPIWWPWMSWINRFVAALASPPKPHFGVYVMTRCLDPKNLPNKIYETQVFGRLGIGNGYGLNEHGYFTWDAHGCSASEGLFFWFFFASSRF